MPTAPTVVEHEALLRRDRRLLYLAGSAVNLGGVVAAAQLGFEPEFALTLVLLTAVGVPVSTLFRRLGFSRLPVNLTIVAATAGALVLYVQRSPWAGLFGSEALRSGLLGLSTVEVYSLLVRAIALLAAFRTFGLLGDRDVVLSILPALSILVLVGVIRPVQVVLPWFLLFAAGAVLCFVFERRLRLLSLPNQLGSALARRRSLPLSLRLVTALVCMAAAGAYGLSVAFEEYQPTPTVVERYGFQLAWLIADLMAEASRDSLVSASEFLDLAWARGNFRNAPLFEVKASRPAYWRTSTFVRYDGRAWRGLGFRGDRTEMRPEGVWIDTCDGVTEDQLFRHTVTARSPLLIALPCAYRPVWVKGDFRRVRLSGGGRLSCSESVEAGGSYTVLSCPTSRQRRLVGEVRQNHLDLPPLPPEVSDLALEATRGSASAEGKAQRLAQYLRRHYRYSLRPGFLPRGEEAVSYFLLKSRRGYCVHFASAMAVCLRTLGIPSRVVTGFAPGECDASRGVFVVGERDAHAWVEAWLPGKGWTPFDPTYGTLTAPRQQRSWFARTSSAVAAAFGNLRRRVAEGARARLGLVLLAAATAVAAAVVLTLLLRSRQRRSRREHRRAWTPADEIGRDLDRVYRRALRLLARRLGSRAPAQTPHEYAAQIAGRAPSLGGSFGGLTDLYVECRFSQHPIAAEQSDVAQGLLLDLRQSLRRRPPTD